MTKKNNIAKQLLEEGSVREARRSSDTVHVWETFREQALLWRAIALFQVPTTVAVVIFAAVIWANRSITLNVPLKPLPGMYQAQEIPDAEFVAFATNFVNLIATYQPRVARRQFEEAAQQLHGDIVEIFQDDMFKRELRAIEDTGRVQVYYVDPGKTTIERLPRNEVLVKLTGDRSRIVARHEISDPLAYKVLMTTIPRNSLNPYGVVVKHVEQSIGAQELRDDRKTERRRQRPPQR